MDMHWREDINEQTGLQAGVLRVWSATNRDSQRLAALQDVGAVASARTHSDMVQEEAEIEPAFGAVASARTHSETWLEGAEIEQNVGAVVSARAHPDSGLCRVWHQLHRVQNQVGGNQAELQRILPDLRRGGLRIRVTFYGDYRAWQEAMAAKSAPPQGTGFETYG
jgi:outer membrane PBP1 activator LpoA protein